MNKDTERLRQLTEQLPPFPDAKSPAAPGQEYQMTKGVCIGWHEYNNDYFGVHRWLNSKGTEFPKHTHNEYELIYVYEGEMLLYIENDIHRIQPKQWVEVPVNKVHCAEFPKDCHYYTITIPSVKDFPHE